MKSLLPCPFCGGSDLIFTAAEGAREDRDYGLAVMCVTCGGSLISSLECVEQNHPDATVLWNKRVS